MNEKEILDMVNEVADERAAYTAAAKRWENMFALKHWQETPQQALEQKGQEQLTLPTPYNVVHLARRLIAGDPRVEVPSDEGDNDTGDAAQLRERWLAGFWQRSNKEQRRHLIADASWQALVRGRFAFYISWVHEDLPDRLKERRLPILLRTLDPLNVGVKGGQLYTQYAYHRYSEQWSSITQRYPKLKRRKGNRDKVRTDEVEAIDFWWHGDDGAIWHAVLVDEQFAVRPTVTPLLDIPIVEGFGDSAPVTNEEYRGLSILYPIENLWPYHNRLASQVGTGLLYYFWPLILITSEFGTDPNLALKLRPGRTELLPPGVDIKSFMADVNVPLAQTMINMIDRMQQESTFPGVMYGQAPGELQAGYGVSLLADAARGRIDQFRRNLETAVEHINEIALALVEDLADPKKGVPIWAKSESSGNLYRQVLRPSDIKGQYENMVELRPAIPTDDIQQRTIMLREVEAGIRSKRTYRDRVPGSIFPEDEDTRIWIERAYEDPSMQPKRILQAFRETYPHEWQQMIAGTPLAEIAMQKDQPPGMMPPQGMPPQGMPPGMMPPQGMPPQGMPIQPPGMGIPGLPPEAQGQFTPEMMGLGPNLPPEMWAQMMGLPLPPNQELNEVSGIADMLPDELL